ncbi:MAG: SDR family oxidoreductase [Acidobacteriota bacterium]|nr:SDR family oxidoreductase [Acidobacteriota bacterium]
MRRVLITGTTRGLGRFLAEHFLASGDRVIGCGRGASALEHERYRHHVVNVSDEASVAELFGAIRREESGLDVLINNAGTASMNAFALTPPRSVRKVLDTNILGTMLMSHAALRLLRRSSHGRIVNLTSIAVALRLSGEAVYAASKSAVETFTRVLAKELGPLGITCNAVGPSLIPTALTSGIPADKAQRLLAEQAVPRQATPGDVANVIDFFVRPESDLVTGQVIYLGGFS